MTPKEKANARLADAHMTAYRMGEIARRNQSLIGEFDKDIGGAYASVARAAWAAERRLRKLIEGMKE